MLRKEMLVYLNFILSVFGVYLQSLAFTRNWFYSFVVTCRMAALFYLRTTFIRTEMLKLVKKDEQIKTILRLGSKTKKKWNSNNLYAFYLQKKDLNTFKIIFCDVIRCSIGVYILILLKAGIGIFYIPNIPN